MSEGSRRVALSFDAEHANRPRHVNADRILDVLRTEKVRASFFIQGRWATAYPETARAISADGHLVGNHSHYHARMPLLTDEGIRSDVRDAHERVAETTGVDPRPWFRCPFGAGGDDRRVLGVIGDLGYRNVGWHVEVEDWEPWRTAQEITHDVLAGVDERGDGAVVLLHTWPQATAEALPMILAGLRERAFDLVGVDELEVEALP